MIIDYIRVYELDQVESLNKSINISAEKSAGDICNQVNTELGKKRPINNQAWKILLCLIIFFIFDIPVAII